MVNSQHIIKTIDSACAQSSSPILGGIINKELQYQAITTSEADMAGFIQRDRAEGLTHFDVPCAVAESAPELQRQYRHVITQGKSLSALNIHEYADGNIYCSITDKTPHFDIDGHIDAAYYLSNILPNDIINKVQAPLTTDMRIYTAKNKPLSLCYEIVDNFSELGLTVRESECMFFIIRQRSAKMIANLQNLSMRTVESYITNIKNKLQCPRKERLIDFAYAYDLLHKIPRSLLADYIYH